MYIQVCNDEIPLFAMRSTNSNDDNIYQNISLNLMISVFQRRKKHNDLVHEYFN